MLFCFVLSCLLVINIVGSNKNPDIYRPNTKISSSSSSLCLSLEAITKALPLRQNYGNICETPSSSSSPSLTPSKTPTPSLTPSSASTPSSTPTMSPTPTPSPSSSLVPTPTPTPSATNTPSATQSPSRTASPTRSISRSPSVTPSTARIELLIQGSIPVGNAWTRSASVFSEVSFSFQFRLLPANVFIGPNDPDFSTFFGLALSPPFLFNFSFSDLVLMYERDINCGPAPGEQACSCKYDCGTASQLPCCANFHTAYLAEFDGDGNSGNGNNPWSVQNQRLTYNFKVVCNGSIIPHFWVGIRRDNTVHSVTTNNILIQFQTIPDTFSTLKPFIPAGTLGDVEKSHGY